MQIEETKEIKIHIDKKVLKKLEEIAELSMVSVSDVIASEVYWFIDRRKDENDRPSGDTDTTMDNSLDADNIVSKMTIPTIEVNAEMDKEIDEYLSKQDGYRESKLDTFNERGFERPLLNGEILKEVDGWLIGWLMTDEGIQAEKWDSDGKSTNTYYNLTPIKQYWYDEPLNFPVRLKRDTEQHVTYRWVYKREDYIKAHRQGFKLVTESSK